MPAPIASLRKNDIIWLANHKCTHRHTFLDHYECYTKENPNKERIGFLDIECSNLDANFGIILSYCIKERGKNKIYENVITKKELDKDLDKELVKKLLVDLTKFDRVVGYYSSRFDVPYIRTRAVVHNLDIGGYGTMLHQDLYFLVRSKFKLNRNRLEVACRTLLGKTDKTHIDPEHWLRGLQGNDKSLKYILDHNRKDVTDLEKLYEKIIGFGKINNTSW